MARAFALRQGTNGYRRKQIPRAFIDDVQLVFLQHGEKDLAAVRGKDFAQKAVGEECPRLSSPSLSSGNASSMNNTISRLPISW